MFCHAQLCFTHDPLSYIVVFCDILREFHMSCLTSTQVDRRRKHTTQRPLQLWLCTVCQRREGWKDVKRSSCHFWMLPFRHWKYIMDFLRFSMIFGNLFRMKQKSMLHVLCAPTAADRLQWWNQSCPTSTNSSKGQWEIVISWQRRSWNHAPSVHMCRCVHVIHADVDESESARLWNDFETTLLYAFIASIWGERCFKQEDPPTFAASVKNPIPAQRSHPRSCWKSRAGECFWVTLLSEVAAFTGSSSTGMYWRIVVQVGLLTANQCWT